jgi:transcriptional regulator with XRE-family HTH domain
MMRVEVQPKLLRWARERAGFDLGELTHRFPQLAAWARGAVRPTLKQIERFAKATYTSIGYFFLQDPPIERVPIPDFRTVGNRHIGRPSPNLLDTIYICQQRQEWYRDFSRSMGGEPLAFVGSLRETGDVVQMAALIRRALGFDVTERQRIPTWTDALRRFIAQADALGVLMMVSGVVGSNNQRKLDPQELRGFALADDLAPLVFINGADTKAAQMFTRRMNWPISGSDNPLSRTRRRPWCPNTRSSAGAIGSRPICSSRWKFCAPSTTSAPTCAMRLTAWRAGSR